MQRIQGLSLRQAALVVGFAYLLNPVSYAEFSIYPKLVIPGSIEQTVSNVTAHHGLYLTLLFAYLVNFVEDILIAWGLYVLLAPVNRALSMLAAWFQLIYATIAIAATFNLATAYRILTAPVYVNAVGVAPLHAQVDLLIHTFRYNYALGLLLFGIHLLLVGYLIVRSTYIPRWLGIILFVNGLGWIVNSLQPYLSPNAMLDFVFVTFFGELIFMIWLLVWGWRIPEPIAHPVE